MHPISLLPFAAAALAATSTSSASASSATPYTAKNFVLKVNVTNPDALSGFNGSQLHNYPLVAAQNSTCAMELLFVDAASTSEQPWYYQVQGQTANSINFDSGNSTLGLTIANWNESDASGRRPVTATGCGAGDDRFYFVQSSEDAPLVLAYLDNDPVSVNTTGTFYTCYNADTYAEGPALYYRGVNYVTPSGCADVVLLPEW
jgi:hypothetical protein